MVRSLNSAAAGLKTHQLGMDVIGNNISNVNTTAFKSTKVSFDNLLQQTLKPANSAVNNINSVNSNQVGLGSTAGAKRISITADGASRTTDEPLDLRISDTGSTNFFIVAEGNNIHYTRDGRLSVDAKGDLVMAATGYYVYGWTSNDGSTITKTNPIQKIHIVDEDIKNSTYAEATSKAKIYGTIYNQDTSLRNGGIPVSIDMYDAKGNKVTASFSFTSANLESSTYYMQLSSLKDADGNELGGSPALYSINFNPDTHQVISVNGADGSTANVDMPAIFGASPIAVDLSDLKIKEQNEDDYVIKGSLPAWVTIDEGTTPGSADLGYFANNLTLEDGDHVSATLDFTNFPANKESLIGSGFYNTCCTCKELYSIRFVDESESSYESSGNHNIYNIGIKDINTTEELLQAILDATEDGHPSGHSYEPHYTQYVVDGNKLTIYDNRAGQMANEEKGWGLFGRGVAEGINVKTQSSLKGEANGDGAGYPEGYYTGYTVDTAGRVFIEYSNGARRLDAWIAMAQFQNPMGLESSGNDVYDQTLNSGTAQVDTIDARSGSLISGQLEMSNVDLSEEMTQMIIMQRAFQANSRIISTSDQMLELLSNLKR